MYRTPAKQQAAHRQFMECGRKVQFISREEATNRADAIAAKGGPQMRPYQCRHCHGYHLTKKGVA